ncbi:hypothetical protein E2I00_014739, partial [Balaenoptera physalus]
HGTCSCGRCVCGRGWFGELCQHPRKCNLTEEQSRSLCESADGVLCSGKESMLDYRARKVLQGALKTSSCHCGKCVCSAEEWYVSGEFCGCDDRECDKHDGLICTGAVSAYATCPVSRRAIETGNGICSCGNCECWDGWNGNACEIWLGTEYP